MVYSIRESLRDFPLLSTVRIPRQGGIDLTERCNNNCQHCWISRSADDPIQARELSQREIITLIEQARALGCREWNITGGEPMLRQDFGAIYQYLLDRGFRVTLNTNGTLITREIAELMLRPAVKLISIYGAMASTHDTITRSPGSFEAVMAGFELLKSVGANFTVQVMPMSANFHELDAMLDLARSLSDHVRYGGAWLYLRADGDERRNRLIRRMRVAPEQVLELDGPSGEEHVAQDELGERDWSLLFPCAAGQDHFFVDAYGRFLICPFVRHPDCTYDLRRGSLAEAWEDFVPRVKSMRGDEEYQEGCMRCELRRDCRWCPGYAYLEHHRLGAPVEYLCRVAEETVRWKDRRDEREQIR